MTTIEGHTAVRKVFKASPEQIALARRDVTPRPPPRHAALARSVCYCWTATGVAVLKGTGRYEQYDEPQDGDCVTQKILDALDPEAFVKKGFFQVVSSCYCSE